LYFFGYSNCRAWVYTFVSADCGGDVLLPHFINYYHQLGITYRRFLILVHHTPDKFPRAGLERLLGICQGYAVECKLWEGEYSPDRHLEHELTMLRDFVDEPLDWVVIADVDELQEWPTADLSDYLGNESQETLVTYFMGNFVDRVTASGELAEITPVNINNFTPSLFDQFPLKCVPHSKNASSSTTGRSPAYRQKVIAFKNYLRPGRSRRRVISPDAAKSYFSPCKPGRMCPRSGLEIQDTQLDLFNLTPYSWYENRYHYTGTPKQARGEKFFWPYKVNTATRGGPVYVHHFQFHSGLVEQTRDKLQRYRGNCDVDVDLPACKPLVPQWPLVAAAWRRLRTSLQVDTSGMRCELATKVGVTADIPNGINTAYMGLAWEEFEENLNVEAKVRNTVKGDSQTRLAGMLGSGEQEVEVKTEWDDIQN
jgi:hypothetical protein